MQDTTQEAWADDVHRFWFEELRSDQWFRATPEIDALIRRRFGPLYEELKQREVIAIPATPRARVAAVIALDQFPRNMFRGSKETYATDGLALVLAESAIAAGFDRSLHPHERQFLYMPLQHSEDRQAQARSVASFAELGVPELLRYARHHQEIVDRFGRFPHRNAILGRPSTPEEIEFLKTHPF
jgi:uncharacterized protein (DUF924 family)